MYLFPMVSMHNGGEVGRYEGEGEGRGKGEGGGGGDI